MRRLRVLLQCRHVTLRFRGGEVHHILELREELRRRDVQADITSDYAPNLDHYDLVHLFSINAPTETLLQARHARKHRKPIVLSPVYQNLDEYDAKGQYGIAKVVYGMVQDPRRMENWKNWFRALRSRHYRQLLAGYTSVDEQRRRIVSLVDGFITNSHMEMEALRRDYKVAGPYAVATNAANPIFFEASPDHVPSGLEVGRFIICAAVLSSLKNQLRLIRSLRHSGLTVVLAGRKISNHGFYYRLLQREASRGDPRVIMLGEVSMQQLSSLYAAAKVVVLPSWFETCGMACLEGAAAGANVVITNRGYTAEYFRDFAWYCDPSDENSIRHAVLSAYESTRRTDFANYIRTHYSWEKTAEAAIELYQKVVRIRRTGERVLGSGLVAS